MHRLFLRNHKSHTGLGGFPATPSRTGTSTSSSDPLAVTRGVVGQGRFGPAEMTRGLQVNDAFILLR